MKLRELETECTSFQRSKFWKQCVSGCMKSYSTICTCCSYSNHIVACPWNPFLYQAFAMTVAISTRSTNSLGATKLKRLEFESLGDCDCRSLWTSMWWTEKGCTDLFHRRINSGEYTRAYQSAYPETSKLHGTINARLLHTITRHQNLASYYVSTKSDFI